MAKRLDWIDQARGLSIFLVVYGHNFPVNEPYIYSFHVPLFFLIAGMFHPEKVDLATVKRRAKMILIPYFVWAIALFLFWYFFGRNYGDSAGMQLSPLDNFIGIFYAQGGPEYMDWGIPMWFLPCIFLVFMFFSLIKKINNHLAATLVFLGMVCAGFFWPVLTGIHLPWSLDVALVAMGFYGIGHALKEQFIGLTQLKTLAFMIMLFVIHLAAFYYNTTKPDMYRSIYGNEILFFIGGLTGSVAYILFFKLVPVFKFLGYLGRHTIVLLATHSRMLTVLKFMMMLIMGVTFFSFTETEKFILSVIQVIMVIPIIWLVNKYAPILDGKIKKS
jgi:acyltransferase